MIPRFLSFVLLAGSLGLVSACTTTRSGNGVEKHLELPAPTPSREVKPGETFGLEPLSSNGDGSKEWKSAVRIQLSVLEVGFERKGMGEHELKMESADLDTILEEMRGVELLAKPVIVTLPGRNATIESVVQLPVLTDTGKDEKTVKMIATGFMASVRAEAPEGVGPQTRVSEIQNREIPLRVLAAINDQVGERVEVENPAPIVRQYRLNRTLNLEPGVTTEIGRIVRETTEHVTDKVPVLGDLPVFGKVFRRRIELELRKTTVITVRADWVDPEAGE